ncbi:hypothetical protein ACTJK9_03895 [Pseudomonas sp. 22082]|uniref:hypothetical protein n=1 Tax=Pseudomonas sp. 22082 TaxID=3453868 RepID=UPI003F86276F
MDFDSFNQCLAYIEFSKEEKSLVVKFLPIIGALSGALIGFFLNYASTHSKENKIIKNKILCCKEDVDSVRDSLQIILKELFRIAGLISRREPLPGHNLPTNVSSLCLSEYFSDVAHKLSSEQRFQIQRILEDIKALNSILEIIQKRDSLKDKFTYSLKLSNSIILGLRIYATCKQTFNDEIVNKIEGNDFQELGIDQAELSAFFALKENGNNENQSLNL